MSFYFSKSFWKYVFPWKYFLGTTFGTYGGLLTAISIFEHFKIFPFLTKNTTDSIIPFLIYLALGIIMALITTKPFKQRYSYRLNGTDMYIQIIIGDLFKQKGDLVIPFNTSLDTSIADGIIRPYSTQGIFTQRFYGKSELLDDDIKRALPTGLTKKDYLEKEKGNRFRYPIGTVIYLNSLPKSQQKVYLLALADMNTKAMAETDKNNVEISLGELWSKVSNQCYDDEISMPVLGTGMARLPESRVDMCKTIIDSYIAATKQERKKLCSKLNIVIYPRDLDNNELDFKSLFDFCDYKCRFYDFTPRKPGKGTGLGD